MTNRYDLIVVGTGAAATSVASRARKAGWRVAIVDYRPFGGTCALRGCDPKKVLVGGAEVIDAVRRMRGRGVAGDVGLHWRELMAFKRTFTDPVPPEREKTYALEGITAFHGRARFIGRNSLAIEGTELEGGKFVLAMGAEPVHLGIPGEEHLVTNEGFLSLEQLPKRIVFVGGGYIAAEFSNLAARAGAQVTVLQRGGRLLPNFDPDLVGWLMEAFRDAGIDVRTNATVQAIERKGSGFRVRFAVGGGAEARGGSAEGGAGAGEKSAARGAAGAGDQSASRGAAGADGKSAATGEAAAIGDAGANGESASLDADLVVHAAGRVPALRDLDLEKADVAVKKGRIEVNDFLQSASNPDVYAAGDAAQKGPPLTPIASYDAEVVAANLLEGNRRKASYVAVPSVAFTIPPIAAVGLSEARARAEGLHFRVSCRRASDWYTARRVAETTYGYKTLIEESTDRILGAHLVGPGAEETINVFALAIRHGLTATDLKSAFFAYPTPSSDISYML